MAKAGTQRDRPAPKASFRPQNLPRVLTEIDGFVPESSEPRLNCQKVVRDFGIKNEPGAPLARPPTPCQNVTQINKWKDPPSIQTPPQSYHTSITRTPLHPNQPNTPPPKPPSTPPSPPPPPPAPHPQPLRCSARPSSSQLYTTPAPPGLVDPRRPKYRHQRGICVGGRHSRRRRR